MSETGGCSSGSKVRKTKLTTCSSGSHSGKSQQLPWSERESYVLLCIYVCFNVHLSFLWKRWGTEGHVQLTLLETTNHISKVTLPFICLELLCPDSYGSFCKLIKNLLHCQSFNVKKQNEYIIALNVFASYWLVCLSTSEHMQVLSEGEDQRSTNRC